MKPSFDGVVERQYQYFLEEWDGDDDPPSFEEWLEEEEEMDAARDVYYSSEEYAEAMDEAEESRRNPMRTHGPCVDCGVEMNDYNHRYDTSASRRGAGAGTGILCDQCYTIRLSEMEPMIDFDTGEILVPREPIYTDDGVPIRNPMTEDKSSMYRNIGLLTLGIGALYWLKDK